MPYSPINMGNAMLQGEQILNARAQRDPNNLQNQLLAEKLRQLQNPQPMDSRFGGVDPTAEMKNFAFRKKIIEDMKQAGKSKKEIIQALQRFDDSVSKGWYGKIGNVPSYVNAGMNPVNLGTLGGEMTGEASVKGAGAYASESEKMRAQAGLPSTYSSPEKPGELNLGVTEKPVTAAGLAADKKREETKAKYEQTLENTQPKRIGAVSAAQDRTATLKGLIKQAKEQANSLTVGFLGDTTKDIPGTPAHDLSQTLLTLQANAGFDRLKEMRDNSVSGGALGQVSERELSLLMAAYAALAQSQSKPQFIQNLNRFEKQVEQSWERVKLAYRLDYGEDYIEPEQGGQTPAEKPLSEYSLEELQALEKQLSQ